MTVALTGMTLHHSSDTDDGTWDSSNSGSDGADAYFYSVEGANSESWLVSKNATQQTEATKSAALNASRGLVMFWMSSNLSPYYTGINVELESTSGNHKNFEVANSTNRAIGGNFVSSVMDYVNKGTETGTFVPASFSLFRPIVDNSSSGNIRAVINNWIDAIFYGPGHTASGTTTTDLLFNEMAVQDDSVKAGIMWNFNDVIFCQGDLSLTGTALVSIGESLVFVDTLNGYDRYNFDLSGTVTLTNTNISGSGTIDFDMDCTGGTFSMTGGSLAGMNLLTLVSGQTLNGVVITDSGLISLGNTPVGSTFNNCDQISFVGSGGLTDCIINGSSNASAILTDDLSILSNNTFNSDGTGHAIDMPTEITANRAEPWNNQEDSYGATDTANSTITCNVALGFTLQIDVAGGASVPTVNNTGAGDVNVVAGATIEVTNLVTGSRVRVTRDSDDAEIYNGSESAGTITFGTSYAGTFTVSVRKSSASPFYVEWLGGGTSTIGQTTSVKALQQSDE